MVSSGEREQPMTVAPARNNSCAMPTPTPLLVPVTIAILPSSTPMLNAPCRSIPAPEKPVTKKLHV
jgi:hypothetical protein